MTSTIATYDAVAGAVDALRRTGTNPTADAVIRHIGGGSKPTVLAHLRLLRKEVKATEAELPPGIMDMVRPALAEIYASGAFAEAERSRTRADRQEKLLDEMDAQISELAAENQALQDRLEASAVETQRFSDELGVADGHIAWLKAELETGRRELEQTRRLTGAGIADLVARIEALAPERPPGRRTERNSAPAPVPANGLFEQETEKNDQ